MTRRRIKSSGTARKPVVNHKTFKAEGRNVIKFRQGLVNEKIYELKGAVELPARRAGCVGQVNPGTIVQLAKTRNTMIGPLYVFDGFVLTEKKELKWIGEFDTMDIDDVAVQCGREITPDEYVKVVLPEDEGYLKVTMGEMIHEETSDARPAS